HGLGLPRPCPFRFRGWPSEAVEGHGPPCPFRLPGSLADGLAGARPTAAGAPFLDLGQASTRIRARSGALAGGARSDRVVKEGDVKYLMLILDGASDRPLPEFAERTPLEIARLPNLRAL